ncbi:hypothetical protein [Siccibacter colletis]|uniref:hypothetical protein n=1 Tax=Siccibacter colletis TaxID=1505757 RepID=UPI0004E265F6|nr:hypothetical protein [Siccibacter colletis]
MNIVRWLIKNHPLDKMFVPSGWLIAKNNLIKLDAGFLNQIPGVEDRFLVKENFFSSCIFYASHEFLNDNLLFKSVIDVECVINRDEKREAIINSYYVVSYNIYKGKSKKHIFGYDIKCESPELLATELNFILWFHSWVLTDELNGGIVESEMLDMLSKARSNSCS